MNSSVKDPYVFDKRTIEGVDIYTNHLTWSPCVHMRLALSVGALEDPKGSEGLSHLLEHLIFDGSKLYPSKKAIKDFSKEYLLDSANAWTSFFDTTYHAKCLPENFEKAFEGLWDITFNPLLEEKSIIDEKDVIRAEAWQRHKNKLFTRYLKEFRETIYGDHPASRMTSALGEPGGIDKISREEIAKWHKEKYHKGRLTVFLTGAVSDTHLEIVKKFAKSLPDGKRIEYSRTRKDIPAPKVALMQKSSKDIGDEREQAQITISRVMPRLLGREEIVYGATALLESLLYEELRDKRALCYGVGVHSQTLMDIAHDWVRLSLAKEKVKEAEEAFWNIIESFREKGRYAKEFEKERKIALEGYISKERTGADIADQALEMFTDDGKITPLSEIIADMKKLRYEDVAAYILEAYDRKKVFTAIILS